jgi:hypothetical protein
MTAEEHKLATKQPTKEEEEEASSSVGNGESIQFPSPLALCLLGHGLPPASINAIIPLFRPSYVYS